MRLIDADALKCDFYKIPLPGTNNPDIQYVSKKQIDNAPTIECEEVNHYDYDEGYDHGYADGLKDAIKHGEWRECLTGYMCSNCHKVSNTPTYHCSYCGAYMNMEYIK